MTDDKFNKLDEMIEAALTDQDHEILKETEELGYLALGLSQFGGKLGWVTWVLMLLQGTMFVAAVWCAIKFYAADTALLAIQWGIPSAALAIMALQIKLSLAPQMQADRVIREVKRLQLMIISK
ncbi:hypothetical protein F9L33_07650 [Amylibacter sp. SFDW26]|uniref:DUF6768 family protein n=1 Tax=Amylibacter sp. SFDW26 TaxID=2652722 RepID=UPI00126183BA|nr:DUF6768 family protein [Amylibacter sp. SFDW26]KAB7614506.1 hypothetical protein F9L33_07650 [Amylibacter sp. SFDW26]